MVNHIARKGLLDLGAVGLNNVVFGKTPHVGSRVIEGEVEMFQALFASSNTSLPLAQLLDLLLIELEHNGVLCDPDLDGFHEVVECLGADKEDFATRCAGVCVGKVDARRLVCPRLVGRVWWEEDVESYDESSCCHHLRWRLWVFRFTHDVTVHPHTPHPSPNDTVNSHNLLLISRTITRDSSNFSIFPYFLFSSPSDFCGFSRCLNRRC